MAGGEKKPAPRVHFRPARGSRLSRQDAEVVGGELHRLAKAHKRRVSARLVVEEAKKASSPLHDYFEWDDSEAAEQYRLSQARHLIRSVKVEVKQVGSSEPVLVRAFVHIVRSEEPSYVPVQAVMESTALQAEVLAEALSALRSWQEKYLTLLKAVGVDVDVKRVMNRLRGADQSTAR